ncbi:MAG: type II toxin-antitoxin system HicA family toxin [Pseudonocardia sp.]|nr:type II toxin-antitoxin system HicA family toxin [Pseudonocardia sp.]
MSPALPQVSGREVVRALETVGFVHKSTKGSHAKLRHPDGRIVIVPLHRTMARGTIGSVLRQADASAGEFVRLLG